ncbi:hypothetical protein cce_4977 [Crocosphaera subtropica ATCC 51142]|uniref:Uncharacterized protein n=1 Tax=Crocosphaera subtropica (strain ATCC 51142 / BH68) TaxID=43989 RepID=B1X2G2_CROS5|nr:hypothetical protein cce_4977 [Crocosphaera subtropica ATCC 51142]
MSYTKDQLKKEFSLDDSDFKETIKAIGLSPNKKNFTQKERDRIEEAIKLFDSGAASSYEDMANYFKQKYPASVDSSITAQLDQQAVETGLQLGERQAQIMSQVIPQVTVKRLAQMIKSGQLRENFQQYWNQATQEGEDINVSELVDDYLETYQITTSTTPTNLLNSSTESSENDSDLP